MQLGICPCCTIVVRTCHEQGQVIRGPISLSKLRAFLSSTSKSIQTPLQLLRQLKPCETSSAKYPRLPILIVSARKNEERDNTTAQYTTVNIPGTDRLNLQEDILRVSESGEREMTSLSKKLHRERRSVENPSQGLFRLDRKGAQAYASLFLLPPTTFQMRDHSGR